MKVFFVSVVFLNEKWKGRAPARAARDVIRKMPKVHESEVRLLNSNGEAVCVFSLKADTERDLMKTEALAGKAFEVPPPSPYHSAYHPPYSRLHKY